MDTSLNWKLSSEFLLEQLAQHTRVDLQRFEKDLRKKMNLKEAVIADTRTEVVPGMTPKNTPRHKKSIIWTTPSAVIQSTEYGRITQVEWRRVERSSSKPTIQIKKRRKIDK